MQGTRYKWIIAIDPSGNYNEGKGTSGYCLYNAADKEIKEVGQISARDYNTQETYWEAHCFLLKSIMRLYGIEREEIVVVIEDYTLDPRRAMQQSHSRMETPKVIGILQHSCYMRGIKTILQFNHEAKSRWTDKILLHENLIVQKNNAYYLTEDTDFEHCLNDHKRDAIRHAMHFATFKNKAVKK